MADEAGQHLDDGEHHVEEHAGLGEPHAVVEWRRPVADRSASWSSVMRQSQPLHDPGEERDHVALDGAGRHHHLGVREGLMPDAACEVGDGGDPHTAHAQRARGEDLGDGGHADGVGAEPLEHAHFGGCLVAGAEQARRRRLPRGGRRDRGRHRARGRGGRDRRGRTCQGSVSRPSARRRPAGSGTED